jgi:site-specific recombinase XerD
MWSRQLDRFLAHLAAADRSQCTTRNYRADLMTFAAWFKSETGETPAAEGITGEDLRGFKAYLYKGGEGAKPATVNAKLSALRSFLFWARRAKLISEVPEAPPDVPMMQEDPRWLERDEQRKLLRELERRRNKRDRALVLVLLNTGLRVAELVKLAWRDVTISPRKGELTVRAGKGGKWRCVPLNQTAREAFVTLGHDAKPDPAARVLMSREGPMSVRRVQRIVQDCGKRAGLELSPHMLRHTCAMRLLETGSHMTEVARILGHTSIQTTMRYTTPSGTNLQGSVDRMHEKSA